MTDFAPPAFAVHLGGGAYLDASGEISFSSPSTAQIYEAPDGFRLDTKQLQEVFKDLSEILPADEDTKKKWIEWGISEQTVNALGSIAKIAGIVVSAVSIYVWAIGVLITVMDLMDADDGMSPELSKTLFDIKNQLSGIEQIQRADKMIEMHAEFDGRIDSMRGLLMHLVVEKPVGAKRAQIFADMLTIVDDLDVPLSRVRDQEWATTYDRDRYKWRSIAETLPLYFEHSNGSLVWVLDRSHNTLTMFDYRLGVPMLLYAATTYASLLQVAMPWFRSAGMYAGRLRKTADAIDRFVMRMQDESIARTEYTGLRPMDWQIGMFFQEAWHSPFDNVYPVGAFDLVSYDDSHPNTDLPFVGSFGLFHRNWSTEASYIADAANEQARQDYTNLQVVTGMFRLISTAAWLRFLSTPPDRSQTVSGAAADSRIIRDEARITATSPFIFPNGVIQHPATLKRYDARGRVRITTQEPGYVPAFNYRVVLRTINSHFSKESWADREYVGDIWHTDYEPTQDDPRCNRLRTELTKDRVLSEVVLFERTSPSEPKSRNGTATLQATTFDWYVPVLSPRSPFVGRMPELLGSLAPGGREKAKLGTGGVSIHLTMDHGLALTPTQMMRGPAPLVATTVDERLDLDRVSLGSPLSDVSLDKAERRHAKFERVTVDWELDWADDNLEVRLFGQPQDRPFQAFVVVEETVYSGESTPQNIQDVLSDERLLEQIHTPFVAEMVNQLVFVPEEFFTKERKALEEGEKMMREFDRRFRELGPVHPGDPIEVLQDSLRELTNRSSSTDILSTALDSRVEFAEREAPELWNEVREQIG